MTTYFIKVILCSALFALVYKAILEKEKMHLFNRFYLLTSLAIPFLIPFLTFPQHVQSFPVFDNVINEPVFVQDNESSRAFTKSINYQLIVVLIIYVTVAALLLSRFAKNLRNILQSAWTNPTIEYKNYQIVLLNQNITPHSFLGYIFIGSGDYRNGNIEKEILLHELAHVQQKHSLDILFFEIIQILFWFNPFLFVYRKALLLNHEFLADEKVINNYNNVNAYQNLLLEKSGRQRSSVITSQFNYSITKKRLIMMTKTKSLKVAVCKQICIIPALAILVFFFSTKVIAQDPATVVKPKQIEAQFTKDGITKEQLSEYTEIVNKIINDNGAPVTSKLSFTDRSRLEELFLLMNKEQQSKQMLVFVPAPPPLPRVVPTAEQVESWKNSKAYGLWIDEKRVSNTVLNTFKNTDFAQAFVSKLSKIAVNYGKHFYQVNLMTTDYYNEYYQQAIASRHTYHIGIRMRNKPSHIL